MFRRRPRNFRGRRRAASSGGNEEGPEPGPGRDAEPADGGGDPGDGEGDPDSAAASPEGPGAAGSAEPLPLEEPAGSAGAREQRGRAAAGRGPRPAGAGLARAEKALLSFGGEEEREGAEEFFKIKKPSFSEVTFRIQKKESRVPAQPETEESKDLLICAHGRRFICFFIAGNETSDTILKKIPNCFSAPV